MATNRLFTFNNGPAIGDALQYGNLSVSTSSVDGYRWWPGPDEDLGYVIAHDDTNPNMRTEGSRSATVSTNSIGFWRSAKTNTDFLTMVNGLFNQNFVDGTTAKDWLLTNGYWTSYDVDSLGRFGITSGLILYIDAGNTASYPGTGSNWYDLSGQGHDGSLFAGGTASLPSFNSEYGGSIVFDGISNGCNFVPFIGNYPTPGGVFYETGSSNNLQTFCSWIYGTSSSDGVTEPLENPNQVNGGYNSFFGSNTSSAGMFQLPLFYTSDGQLQLGVSLYGYGVNIEPNIIVSVSASTWNYACVVKTAPSIFDVYFNGDKVITGATRSAYNSNIWDAGYNGLNSFAGGTYSNNGITYSVSSSASSEFALGGWNATQRQPSRVRSVQIYNRALSEQEIIENYNTQKIGFGFSSPESKLKSFITGGFTSYNGTSTNGLIKLNYNGTIDNTFSFGTGLSHSSYNFNSHSVLIQSDDKILVGGNFTSYNGTSTNNIIRLNPDGSIDTDFNIGTGFDGLLLKIKTQTDGKIIAVGGFTLYNGVSSREIIRLNSDGTIDNTFSVGTGFNSSLVYDVEIQSDGKIIAGGVFTEYNGTSSPRIARLNSNGTIDNGFSVGTGFNDVVFSLAIQSDGKVLVGGQFTLYNSTTCNGIIRLNSDGSIDNGFSVGSGLSDVRSIKIQYDGKIIAVGAFTSYNGTSVNRIIRLNSDGSIDNGFTIGSGFNYLLYDLKIQADGKIIVIGNFTSYNGTSCNGIIRLNTDGTIDNGFTIGSGFNFTIGFAPSGID